MNNKYKTYNHFGWLKNIFNVIEKTSWHPSHNELKDKGIGCMNLNPNPFANEKQNQEGKHAHHWTQVGN
jgi:hypothetical protein